VTFQTPRRRSSPELDLVKFLARPTGNSGEFKILNPKYGNTFFRISAAKDSLFFSESAADGGGSLKLDHRFTGLKAK
jgi:hypothetical protein